MPKLNARLFPTHAEFFSTGYYREGFLSIQRGLDTSIIHHFTGTNDAADVPFAVRRYPFPPYTYDPYLYVLQNNLPSAIVLSFLVMAPNICKDLVLEKERKLRVRREH